MPSTAILTLISVQIPTQSNISASDPNDVPATSTDPRPCPTNWVTNRDPGDFPNLLDTVTEWHENESSWLFNDRLIIYSITKQSFGFTFICRRNLLDLLLLLQDSDMIS